MCKSFFIHFSGDSCWHHRFSSCGAASARKRMHVLCPKCEWEKYGYSHSSLGCTSFSESTLSAALDLKWLFSFRCANLIHKRMAHEMGRRRRCCCPRRVVCRRQGVMHICMNIRKSAQGNENSKGEPTNGSICFRLSSTLTNKALAADG